MVATTVDKNWMGKEMARGDFTIAMEDSMKESGKIIRCMGLEFCTILPIKKPMSNKY